MLIFKDTGLRQQILNVSIPAMLEMVMYMVIGVVDVAIVGRLGAAPLAAVGLGAEIFFSVVLFLEALAIGSSILVAQAKGSGRLNDTGQVTAHTLVLALLLGVLVSFLGLSYSADILGLFSVEPAVYAQALDYLLITFKVAPFALILYMLHSIFRGLGRTDIPMYIALIINIFNSVADYVLVYGKWGFPRLGVAGAAWGTALAHILGFIMIIFFLLTGRGGISLHLDNCKLKWRVFRDIFRLGIPSLVEQFFNTVSNLVSIFLIVYIGTVAYASHQLALTVESISYMPGFGIAIAATSLVGQSIGAKDLPGVQKASRGTLEFSLLVMGIFALVFFLLPGQIAALFTNDRSIIPIATQLIRLAAFEQLTIAASMVMGGILRGSGNTRTPMLISTFFTWLFRLPLMYLIIKVLVLPIIYIWGLFVLDWALRALVFFIIYRRRNWLRKSLPGVL